MKMPRAGVLASLLATGCASPMVILVAPGEPPTETLDCFEACEALFGLRPTLNCGIRKEPRPVMTCGYDHRHPVSAPAGGEAEQSCRAECARAGLDKVDDCWSVRTRRGEPTVACRYHVPYH